MPMIQLIRRDGQIIELQAESINFSVVRSVAVWAIPVFGIRAAYDTNANMISMSITGVLTDDREVSGANGAVAQIDLSRSTTVANSWFSQQGAINNDTIAKIVTALHGKEIIFSSCGQKTAGLGENITLRLYSSGVVPAATVATKSIIPVDLTGVISNTGDITTAIKTAFDAASVKVNTATTTIASIFSKGDKVQDLINMTVNASAGGGMLSPQSFTGDLIELPDSLASFDVSKLLRIDQSDSVSKYICGIRIPYDSMVTATGVSEEVRQFIVPSGPGTSYPSEENLEPFDPVDVIGGETVRPNPFFRQGVAIPGVVQSFEPSFAAGDSVWTYTLGFNAAEQLIGI